MNIKKKVILSLAELVCEKLHVISSDVFEKVQLFGIGEVLVEARLKKEEADRIAFDKELIAVLVEEYTPDQQRIARVILENQLKQWYVYNNFPSESRQLGKSKVLGIAAHVVRSIMQVQRVVGIQPMQGPVGLTYSLVYSKRTNQESEEVGLTLEVLSQAVEAHTNKVSAYWNLEMSQDFSRSGILNLDADLTAAIGSEIGTELINNILTDIKQLALTNDVFEVKTPLDTAFLSDSLHQLLITINRASNNIADTTRRSPGNYIITSPLGVSLLQALNPKKHFVQFNPSSNKPTYDCSHMGDLVSPGRNGEEDAVLYSVYCTLALDNFQSSEVNFVVGYKGKNGEIDAGYIFSPYVPVISSGVTVNPITYQPQQNFMTRNGKAIRETALGLSDSKNYYRLVRMNVNLGVENSPK